jgi:hypothetical protein
VHDVISHAQLQQQQEDDKPANPSPKESPHHGHRGNASCHRQRTAPSFAKNTQKKEKNASITL